MNKYLKIPSSRSQLAILIMLMGGALLTIGLLQAIIFPGRPEAFTSGQLRFMQAVTTLGMFLAPALLFAWFTFREKPLYFLGFTKAQKSNFYLLGVLILLASFPAEGWLGQVNKSIPLPAWMVSMEKSNDKLIMSFLSKNSVPDLILNIIIIAVLPGIGEEALFRGALQRTLIRAFKSPWAGIIVTGALFSAIHLQFEGFLPRMFMGVLLGAICWYSGSLWTAILAHFVTNGVQVIAVSFYPKMITENPSVPAYAALLSIVIVVGLFTIMRRQSKVTYAAVYGPETMEES